jgi:predicted dehydrogenase
VDVHYDTARPSIEAGKTVFIEWPVAENVARATELNEVARKHNAQVLVGLQGRYSPIISEIRDVIASGTIGKVVSSDVRALRSLFPWNGLPEGVEYFTDSKIGGNLITVVLGHTMDFIHSLLGEYRTFDRRAQIQKEQVNILSSSGSWLVKSDVPDVVFLHGELEPSAHVLEGATLAVKFRMEPAPFPGDPAFVWTSHGQKGQLRVTAWAGPYLHTDSHCFYQALWQTLSGQDSCTSPAASFRYSSS